MSLGSGSRTTTSSSDFRGKFLGQRLVEHNFARGHLGVPIRRIKFPESVVTPDHRHLSGRMSLFLAAVRRASLAVRSQARRHGAARPPARKNRGTTSTRSISPSRSSARYRRLPRTESPTNSATGQDGGRGRDAERHGDVNPSVEEEAAEDEAGGGHGRSSTFPVRISKSAGHAERADLSPFAPPKSVLSRSKKGQTG